MVNSPRAIPFKDFKAFVDRYHRAVRLVAFAYRLDLPMQSIPPYKIELKELYRYVTTKGNLERFKLCTKVACLTFRKATSEALKNCLTKEDNPQRYSCVAILKDNIHKALQLWPLSCPRMETLEEYFNSGHLLAISVAINT